MTVAHQRASEATTYDPAELEHAAAQLHAYASRRGVDLTDQAQAINFIVGIRALRQRMQHLYRAQSGQGPMTESSDAAAESYATLMVLAVETLCHAPLIAAETTEANGAGYAVGIEAFSAMMHGAYAMQPEHEFPVTRDADTAMIECAELVRLDLAAANLAL